MSTTFLYALCSPGTRTVRYVGKSGNPKERLLAHIAATKRGSQIHVSRWIRQLAAKPELFVIGEIPLLCWQGYEKNAISAARALGMDLTNITNGGEGNSNPKSVEHRAKIGAAHKGKKWSTEYRAKMKGKKKSPEHCAAMSASRKGSVPWNAGKPGRKTIRNTSGFVGVSLRPATGKWRSSFELRGKFFHVGEFSKIEDAVFARNLSIANLL